MPDWTLATDILLTLGGTAVLQPDDASLRSLRAFLEGRRGISGKGQYRRSRAEPLGEDNFALRQGLEGCYGAWADDSAARLRS